MILFYRGDYVANRYTDAQKKASMKYQQERAQIKITVSKKQREKYQELAAERNMSMTELIVSLLEKECDQ